MKFIIEHLEDEVWEWCVLEYKHMSSVVGKENLIFTNVPKKEHSKLKEFGEVKEESVRTMKLNKACLMEMVADKILEPKDAKEFDYFVFGGILGDNPPQGRTKVLHNLFEMRCLGQEQMSTDTAVLVTHKILTGTPLNKIKFQDTISLETNDGEEVILPYRYVVENGKPVLPEGLFEMLRDQEGI